MVPTTHYASDCKVTIRVQIGRNFPMQTRTASHQKTKNSANLYLLYTVNYPKEFFMRPTQKCPKCRVLRKMTGHHVFPRRFFGRKNNQTIFLLCRGCHDKLHRIIPDRRLPKHRSLDILLRFLEDTEGT